LLNVYKTLRQLGGHRHWWPGHTPFEIIVGAILTQNTAWTNVEKAIRSLKRARKLNPGSMQALAQNQLAKLIKPAGYFNVKAKRLKNFLRFLAGNYQGSLKRMFLERGDALRDRLLQVNGIGPETADSILLYAGNKPFFVIDAYTKRIFARHRLLDRLASYEDWQRLFMSRLPRNIALYNDFHAQIVEVGKNFCRSKPFCEKCPMRRYL